MRSTLTKRQLLAVLAEWPDDAKIYIHTTTADAKSAIASADAGYGNELFFRLSGDTVREVEGVSLVADFQWVG